MGARQARRVPGGAAPPPQIHTLKPEPLTRAFAEELK